MAHFVLVENDRYVNLDHVCVLNPEITAGEVVAYHCVADDGEDLGLVGLDEIDNALDEMHAHRIAGTRSHQVLSLHTGKTGS